MADPLATTTQLATYLGAPLANEEQATFALSAASALIVSHCGWSIAAQAETWSLYGSGTELLFVPTLYLREITTLYANGDLVDPDDVTFSSAGVVHYPARWPSGPASVTAVVEQGYEQIPMELVAVTCSLASRWVSMAGRGAFTTYRVGGVQMGLSTTHPGEVIGLNAVETATLDRYRLPAVR